MQVRRVWLVYLYVGMADFLQAAHNAVIELCYECLDLKTWQILLKISELEKTNLDLDHDL